MDSAPCDRLGCRRAPLSSRLVDGVTPINAEQCFQYGQCAIPGWLRVVKNQSCVVKTGAAERRKSGARNRQASAGHLESHIDRACDWNSLRLSVREVHESAPGAQGPNGADN